MVSMTSSRFSVDVVLEGLACLKKSLATNQSFTTDTLKGYRFEAKENSLTILATDGYRLSTWTLADSNYDTKKHDEFSFNVSLEVAEKMLLCDKQPYFQFFGYPKDAPETGVSIQTVHATREGDVIGWATFGDYVNYGHVIPKEEALQGRCFVSAKEGKKFISAMKYLAENDNYGCVIKLTFESCDPEKNNVSDTITAEAPRGKLILPCTYKGPKVTKGIRYEYLKDQFLSAPKTVSDKIEIKFGAETPFIFSCGEYKSIQMPSQL